MAHHRDLCKCWGFPEEKEYFPLTHDLDFYGFSGWSSWWESFPFQKALLHFSQGGAQARTCLWGCISESRVQTKLRSSSGVFRPSECARYVIMTVWKLSNAEMVLMMCGWCSLRWFFHQRKQIWGWSLPSSSLWVMGNLVEVDLDYGTRQTN